MSNTATLTWVNPTTRIDNTALLPTEIASVQIWDVSTSTPIRTQIGQVLGPLSTFKTGTLDAGTHSFTVNVTDVEGNVSDASNSATLEVKSTFANPSAPTLLTAVLD